MAGTYVGLTMSEVTPADLAVGVLKGDLGHLLAEKDKVEKIAPLLYAIPAAFGAYGAYRGAGGQFFDDEGNWDPGFKDTARYEDPLTGGMLASHEIEDANLAQRAGGAALGALQGVNPFSYVRLAGKGATVGAKAIQARRRARDMARAHDALDAGRIAQEGAEQSARVALQGQPVVGNVTAAPWNPRQLSSGELQAVNLTGKRAGDLAELQRRYPNTTFTQLPDGTIQSNTSRIAGMKEAAGSGIDRLAARDRAFQVFPRLTTKKPKPIMDAAGKVTGWTAGKPGLSHMSKLGHMAGRAAQMHRVPAAVGGMIAPWLINQFGDNVDVPMLGDSAGYAGGAGSAGFGGQMGSGGYDPMANLSQGYSQGTPHDLIFDPEMAQGTSATWDDRFVAQPTYGVKTGENMNIGEQLLKEATEKMHKAICPECGKSGCNCKEYKNKEDTDKPPKGKKGGGMILIIGHGKPDKKDKDE